MESLSNKGSSLTIVGAGRVGYYTAYYALALALSNEVVISDTDIGCAQKTAHVLHEKYPDINIYSSNYSSLKNTDVLALATTSTSAIYHSGDFDAGLIISLGADIDYQHELAPGLATTSRIFP